MARSAAVPVIVVGAGPVGLVTALCLARRGVEALVLEKAPAPGTDQRIAVLHPPTLDMLEPLGLTPDLAARGLVASTWQIRRHETHERAVFDLGVLAPDTRHPCQIQIPQAVFCSLALAAAARERRIGLRFAAQARGIVRQERGVLVRWRHAGTEVQALARYVVAADGAGSLIRRLIGLPFGRTAGCEAAVLAITPFRFEDRLPGLSPLNHVWTNDGEFTLMRLRDHWHVMLHADGDDERVHQEPWRLDDPERIEARLQRLVPKLGRYELAGHWPCRVQRRTVSCYRSGRVLLAGDAAHVAGLRGPTGLNRGIHDAVNLADKLARVLAGESEDLLDLYDRQRRHVAEETLLHDRERSGRDPAWQRRELARLQALAADGAAAREYLLGSTMIEELRRAAAIR